MQILEMQYNIHNKFFVLKINAFEQVAVNAGYLQREYLASAVNGLKSSPLISDLTKGDVFNLFLSQNDEKVE